MRLRRWLLVGGGLALLVAVICLPGYSKWQELRERKRQLIEEVARLEQLNQQHRIAIERLQHDPDYIERVARETMRVVRPGEIVVEIKPPDTSTTPSDTGSPEAHR